MGRPKSEYSFLDLAKEVLALAKEPLTSKEIWDRAKTEDQKKIKTKSANHVQVLNSSLNQNIMKPDSIFCLVSKRPARWGLIELKEFYDYQSKSETEQESVDSEIDDDEDTNETNNDQKKRGIERKLHKLLATYVRYDIDFDQCYVKTVYHEKTTGKHKKTTQWSHPDLVGVSYPFAGKANAFQPKILDLMAQVEHSECIFYSFEMKIAIETGNELTKGFFQALSNSSWANKGYLVAAYYNPELYDEMKFLNSTYGIGFIKLNVDDYRASQIILQAKQKRDLDWNRIDSLYQSNIDFADFIDGVSTNMGIKKVLDGDYDSIFDDEDFNKYKEELKKLIKAFAWYKKRNENAVLDI